MSSSKTVTGAAEQLAAKEADLARCKSALAAAESAFDVDAIIRLEAEANVLSRIIPSLRVAAWREAEGKARDDAEAHLKQLAEEHAAHAAAVKSLSEEARRVITDAQQRVADAFDAWSTATRSEREVELLARRFGIGAPKLTPVGPAPDLTTDLVTIALAERARPAQPLVVAHVASETADERTAVEIKATTAYVNRYGTALSQATRDLFARASLPEQGLPETDAARARRERQEADFRRFGEDARVAAAELAAADALHPRRSSAPASASAPRRSSAPALAVAAHVSDAAAVAAAAEAKSLAAARAAKGRQGKGS